MKNILKTSLNGLTVSTIKIGRTYETMVLDRFGNELDVYETAYIKEANHNHSYCVAKYANQRSCIHAI